MHSFSGLIHNFQINVHNAGDRRREQQFRYLDGIFEDLVEKYWTVFKMVIEYGESVKNSDGHKQHYR